MAEDNANSEQMLVRARELVTLIESGEEAEANRLLEEMGRLRENRLFQELGKLTRELHDALKGFQLDSHIASLAEKDIPDAKDRLNYVITMTEQAAHRTLNAVEESLPLAEVLQRRASGLAADWDRFIRREMQADEFRGFTKELSGFLGEVGQSSARIHGNLSDVLMAQDFQDLTGQVIRRVINLIQDVETGLVEIIRVSGRVGTAAPAAKAVEEDRLKAEGPHVPGKEAAGVVSGQDNVDDLLASLGF